MSEPKRALRLCVVLWKVQTLGLRLLNVSGGREYDHVISF